YASGVSLVGVGGASVLLANNPNFSAVVLTGISPSIQNLVVSSALASSVVFTDLAPFTYTLTVLNSQNFVVQGITVTQGAGMPGLFLEQSAVGQVSSVTFNGSGTTPVATPGILMDSCANVSILGNLFLNEATGIAVGVASPF